MRPSAVVVNDGYLCGTGKLNDSSNNLSNSSSNVHCVLFLIL